MHILSAEKYQSASSSFFVGFVSFGRQDRGKGDDGDDLGYCDKGNLEDECIELFGVGSLLFWPPREGL